MSRWFGAAAMSCRSGAVDYGLWKCWRQMCSPAAIRGPLLRLAPDGLSVPMPWWRGVVDSDPALGKLQKERSANPEQKRISGVPADNGPASRPGRAPTTNSPPLQSVKALGPMASHNLHVSGQGQGRPGAGCGTTQCESGLGCDNDAGVGGPSTLPVCRPSIVVVAQEIVDSNELPTASTGQEHTI